MALEFLGSGAFGCAYKLSSDRDSSTISDIIVEPDETDNPDISPIATTRIIKIGYGPEMEKERRLYDIIKTVDPRYDCHYPKPILKSINPANWNETRDSLARTCGELYRKIGENHINYKMLEMNYGGDNLYNIIFDISNRQDLNLAIRLLGHFQNIFAGVDMFLHPQRFVRRLDIGERIIHGDIKTENIVYLLSASTPTPKHMKFIDFGFSKNFNSFQTSKDITYNHFNFPPEIILLTNENIPSWLRSLDIQEFVNDIIPTSGSDNASLSHMWYNHFMEFTGLNLLGVDYTSDHRRDFKDFLEQIVRKAESSRSDEQFYRDFYEEYFNKRDVYALGYTLLDIINYVKSIPSITNADRHFINRLSDLGMELTHFNMYKRITIKKAKEKYSVITTSYVAFNNWRSRLPPDWRSRLPTGGFNPHPVCSLQRTSECEYIPSSMGTAGSTPYRMEIKQILSTDSNTESRETDIESNEKLKPVSISKTLLKPIQDTTNIDMTNELPPEVKLFMDESPEYAIATMPTIDVFSHIPTQEELVNTRKLRQELTEQMRQKELDSITIITDSSEEAPETIETGGNSKSRRGNTKNSRRKKSRNVRNKCKSKWNRRKSRKHAKKT